MIKNFRKDSLKLAELKYYDHKHNGIEVSEPLSYIVLVQVGDRYFNALDPIEELPTFERVHGTTNSYGDDYYGTKVRLVTDGCSTGPCWLISTDYDIQKKFEGEEVTKRELEDYVLNSRDYFKDRYDIAFNRLYRGERLFKMLDIINKDITKKRNIDRFFDIKAEKQFMKHRW